MRKSINLNMDKAQGTIEYLVIIGIVVVISLVVVTMLLGMTDSGTNVNLTTNQTSWLSKEVALTETGIDSAGDTYFILKNNTKEFITLTGYVANDTTRTFTTTTPQLGPGDTKLIFIPREDSQQTTKSLFS